ncbi:uncharacterized protein PITG_01238 [Phytophthora infestans T30-4]|uniref:Uncharacterized protein n=1 Tax=Phytophthora infestans (strain T30-4) TaxID=403677 RepID=D0MUZ8_PHYIT|nr:uncharacterized protein PITG_01238 [Phytophthora infestans T30-4]EEY60994.1 hypothetical protein PITG_01238 [Phytophthora infestans T30-4]|eukprot:XP_002907911.1 hypothetical protein PITG_01238 [Phytophthora infestans T30-4]
MYTADDEEDQRSFIGDLQILLFDEDLQQLNDTVVEESLLRPDVALVALQRLTKVHCPDGARGVIIDEMTTLKKTRNISVREYTRSFQKLERMLQYITDNEAVPTSDVICMYKSGIPVDWQIEVNRLSRSWDYRELIHQLELIDRNEQEEERLRSGGRGQRQRTGQGAQQPRKGRNGGQAPRQNESNFRSRGKPRQQQGDRGNDKHCKFCKRNNHSDNECLCNPESPRRPNNQTVNNRTDGRSRGNDQSFAAMQEQIAEMPRLTSPLQPPRTLCP